MCRAFVVASASLVVCGYAFAPTPIDRHPRPLMELSAQGNPVDRFFRVLRSNVNKLVSNMEDPEKIIVQAVSDMQVRPKLCVVHIFAPDSNA
jgi:PspA/IM30 family